MLGRTLCTFARVMSQNRFRVKRFYTGHWYWVATQGNSFHLQITEIYMFLSYSRNEMVEIIIVMSDTWVVNGSSFVMKRTYYDRTK